MATNPNRNRDSVKVRKQIYINIYIEITDVIRIVVKTLGQNQYVIGQNKGQNWIILG